MALNVQLFLSLFCVVFSGLVFFCLKLFKKLSNFLSKIKLILAPVSAGHPQNFKTEIFPTNHKKGIFSLTLSIVCSLKRKQHPGAHWDALKYIFVCKFFMDAQLHVSKIVLIPVLNLKKKDTG